MEASLKYLDVEATKAWGMDPGPNTNDVSGPIPVKTEGEKHEQAMPLVLRCRSFTECRLEHLIPHFRPSRR